MIYQLLDVNSSINAYSALQDNLHTSKKINALIYIDLKVDKCRPKYIKSLILQIFYYNIKFAF